MAAHHYSHPRVHHLTSVSASRCFSRWLSHGHPYPHVSQLYYDRLYYSTGLASAGYRKIAVISSMTLYPSTVWKVNTGHTPPTSMFREYKDFGKYRGLFQWFRKCGVTLRAVPGQQPCGHWHSICWLVKQISTRAMICSMMWFMLFS